MAVTIPWDRLREEVRTPALHILQSGTNVRPPPHAAVWPPKGDLDHRCMEERIPKAIHAHGTALQNLDATLVTAPYQLQEKFNGVYVLWDGDRLWTKSGREVRMPVSFRGYLPPGFALVGELFAGYGHQPFEAVKAIAQNKAPAGLATAEVRSFRAWQQTRVVAFDVPGCGDLPYHVRYQLLCQVVGSWSERQVRANRDPVALPLQVVRQYPADRLPDMFRDVVEGRPWSQRRFVPFGVPRVHAGAVALPGHPAVRYHPHTPGDFLPVPFMCTDTAVVSGEGLMLWDQGAPWTPRGARGRLVHKHKPAILKYKPVVLTTGRVIREPYLPGHSAGDANDNDNDNEDDPSAGAGGYHVMLKWWNPVGNAWTEVKAYASPNHDARRAAAAFPLHSQAFFTFVFFEQAKPKFMHALGRRLSQWQARNVQTAMGHAVPALRGGAAVRTDVPRLDQVCDAALWRQGEMHPLFPVEFAWDVLTFVRNSAHQLRLAASVVVTPDGGRTAAPLDVPAAMRAANKEATAAQKRAKDQMDRDLRHLNLQWWDQPARGYLPRFLVFTALCTVAWLGKTGRRADWWTREAATTGTPLEAWGPFRLAPLVAAERVKPRWLHALHRVLLSIVAAVWVRNAHVLQKAAFRDTMSSEAAQRFLDFLVQRVASQLAEIHAAWRVPEVYRRVNPPDYREDWLVADRRATAWLCTVARFVLTQRLPPGNNVWQLLLPAWGVGSMDAVPAEIGLDALACHEWIILGDQKQYYEGAYQHPTWVPGIGELRLDPETFLPVPLLAAVVAPVDVVITADPLRRSVAAADLLLRQLVA